MQSFLPDQIVRYGQEILSDFRMSRAIFRPDAELSSFDDLGRFGQCASGLRPVLPRSGAPFLAPDLNHVARRDLAVLAGRRPIVGGAYGIPDLVVRDGALLGPARG